ncbi:MAG: coproporphyrinogen dehydrogenase [Saprospiraceae bacterium]|nr:coproporphyrinogen dehydrogenase [Saprospiraceae bacterium]
MSELINKYNYEVPRYTSYPVITNWKDNLETGGWQDLVKGIDVHQQKLSIYIHLPFCESLCTYCGCNKHITTNHDVEEPYLALLQKEWELYSQLLDGKPIVSELHLGGGTPTFFSANHLSKFLSKMLAGFDTGIDPSYSFEAHPASTKIDHLTALFELGFRRLSIGVQDFNADILRTINRFQTTAQVYDTVALARNAGYTSINFDLIYGLPGQKLSDIETSMGHVATLKPERIAFYSYAHVPWTKPSQRAYNEDDLPQGAEKGNFMNMVRTCLSRLVTPK